MMSLSFSTYSSSSGGDSRRSVVGACIAGFRRRVDRVTTLESSSPCNLRRKVCPRRDGSVLGDTVGGLRRIVRGLSGKDCIRPTGDGFRRLLTRAGQTVTGFGRDVHAASCISPGRSCRLCIGNRRNKCVSFKIDPGFSHFNSRKRRAFAVRL